LTVPINQKVEHGSHRAISFVNGTNALPGQADSKIACGLIQLGPVRWTVDCPSGRFGPEQDGLDLSHLAT